MNLYSEDLMYEFRARDLTQTAALKQVADHAVKDISSTYGWDTDIRITIEPEAKDKHLFSVTMTVIGLKQPVIVRKAGKNPLAVLRRVRKIALRQIHRLTERNVSHRKITNRIPFIAA